MVEVVFSTFSKHIAVIKVETIEVQQYKKLWQCFLAVVVLLLLGSIGLAHLLLCTSSSSHYLQKCSKVIISLPWDQPKVVWVSRKRRRPRMWSNFATSFGPCCGQCRRIVVQLRGDLYFCRGGKGTQFDTFGWHNIFC